MNSDTQTKAGMAFDRAGVQKMGSAPFAQQRYWRIAARLSMLVLLAGAALLQGCVKFNGAIPQWIEAPLVADGQFDPASAIPSSTYQGFGPQLSVSDSSTAIMRFSLAGLPNSASPHGANASPYQLSASRVLSARLVVYVEDLATPGYVGVSAQQDSDANGACYVERLPPRNCGTVLAPFIGNDADTPGVPWQITYHGFNSFDVTDAVKAAMNSGSSGSIPGFVTLQIRGAASNASPAAFTMTSKDQNTGQNRIERSAHLLITLDNAVGVSGRLEQSNSLQASTPDQSGAAVASIPLSAAASAQAIALLNVGGAAQFANSWYVQNAVHQAVSVLRVNAPVPGAVNAPHLRVGWMTSPASDADQSQATWNSVQGFLPAPASLLTIDLDADPDTVNQTVVTDINAFIQQAPGTSSVPPQMWMAVSTNVDASASIDGGASTAAPHPPRMNVAISPTTNVYFDQGDDNVPYSFSSVVSNVKAHVGWPFQAVDVSVRDRNGTFINVPINVRVTPAANGATAQFLSEYYALDFDTSDFDGPSLLTDRSSNVYVLATPNSIAGSYSAMVTMIGHNATPLSIQFQNLPLPTVALSGPTSVTFAPDLGSVTVPANALDPFRLIVGDSGNTDILDDTNKWVVTSSNAGDTVPRTISQADGSKKFALTFFSLGQRTITVTNVGSPQITASFICNVKLGPQLTTSPGLQTFQSSGGTTSVPVPIDPGITVSEDATATLAYGSVAISDNIQNGEDVLGFTNDGMTMGNISASYDAATGVLSMTSPSPSATPAQWQAALRTVTYTNTASTPHDAVRTISFSVTDTDGTASNIATRSLAIVRFGSGAWLVLTAAEAPTLDSISTCTPAAGYAGGTCATLREAINQAVDGDTIYFAENLDGGTINLSQYTNCLSSGQSNGTTCLRPSAGWPTTGPQNGQVTQFGASAFFISGKTLTIDATQRPDPSGNLIPMNFGVTIARSGTANFRLFDIDVSSGLTLRGLSLQNGAAVGGGSGGGGGALGAGGAIFNRGALTLDRCTLSGNQARGGRIGSGNGGGGVGAVTPDSIGKGGGPNGGFGDGGFGGGGGVGGFGGGGGLNQGLAGIGYAVGYAGGFGGGGGTGDPRSIVGGSPPAGGIGGFGGGAGGFTFDSGAGGGGAGMGGAIFNDVGTVRVVNSTFTLNQAIGGSAAAIALNGGYGGAGYGGALFNYNGDMRLSFSTITGNTVNGGLYGATSSGVADGGAIYSLGDSPEACSAGSNVSCAGSEASLTLFNSIAALSSQGNDVVINAIHGAVSDSDGSGNLITTTGGGFSGTVLNNADPLLAPLPATYASSPASGFGLTMVPQQGSPVIDSVGPCDGGFGDTLTIDQRGVARPQGSFCDIGAVEYRQNARLQVNVDGPGIVSAGDTPAPMSGRIFNCMGGGGINVNCSAQYRNSEGAPVLQVTLTATPQFPGYGVVWSADCANAGTATTATVSVTRDTDCSASFGQLSYTFAGTASGQLGAVSLQLVGSNPATTAETISVAPGATNFSFNTSLISGSSWSVDVLDAPAGQRCSVSPASGSGLAANVSNLVLSCAMVVVTIAPASLPNGTFNASYSPVQFNAASTNGGLGPYTYTVTSGGLPPGMGLADGVLSGTPASVGSYTFGLTAVSSNGFGGSRDFTIEIDKANQQITNFIAVPSAPVYAANGSFLVSATPGGSTSPLVFSAMSPTVCTLATSGPASATVTMHGTGSCVLTADQAGDTQYIAAAQVTQNVAIGVGSQVITFAAQVPSSHVFVAQGTFPISPLATGGASGNPVTYSSLTTSVCTTTATTTVTMVGTGTCTIAADQVGDTNYAAAAQVTQNVAIGVGSQTITFPAQVPANQAFIANGTFAIDPLATGGASDNPVTYASTTNSVCTVAGATVTMLGTGTCTIAADQMGDTNYAAATQQQQSVVIDQASQTITFTSTPPEIALVGDTYTVVATGGASGNPVTLTIDAASTSGACTLIGNTVSFSAAGTCVIDADQAGDTNYAAAAQAQQSVAIAQPALPPVQVPALDRWALLLLGGVLGLFGLARVRRAQK